MVTQTPCPNHSDVSSATLLVATHAAEATQMIHVGNNVGLIWEHPYGDGGQDIETAIIDSSGNTLVGPSRVTPLDGKVNWNGRLARGDGGYIVVYEDYPGPARFAFLSQNLQLIPGTERPFPGTEGTVQQMPDVDWDPVNQQWGLYWQEGGAPMFSRMTSSGAPLGSPVQLATLASWSGTRAVSNSLQWTGSEHAVLYPILEPDGGSRLTLSRISTTGNVTASNTIALGPSIVNHAFGWNGSEFGITWTQRPAGIAVHFARATASGALIPGTLATISNASAARGDFPAIAWTGTEWLLAWVETPNGFDWDLWTVRRLPSTRRQLNCVSGVRIFPALLPLGTSNLLTHRRSTTGIVGPTELLILP